MQIGRNQPCPCGSGKKYKHCCGVAPVSQPTQVSFGHKSLLERAGQSLQSGQIAHAEALLLQVLESEPNSLPALTLLANVQASRGAMDEAQTSFRRAIAVEPGDPQLHGNFGVCLKHLGRAEEAIAAFQQALLLDPAYLRARVNMAAALQDLGRHEAAVAECDEVLRSEPQRSEAHLNRAISLSALGRANEAQAAFELACKFAPGAASPRYNLGRHLQALGQLSEAAQAFEQCVILDGRFAQGHVALADCLVSLNQWRAAQDHYLQAITVAPRYAEAHQRLAGLLQAMHNLPAAKSHYERALELAPTDAEIMNNLGAVYYDEGQYERAVTLFRQAAAQQPDYAPPRFNLGNALGLIGQFDEARAAYEQGLQLQPEDGIRILLAAWCPGLPDSPEQISEIRRGIAARLTDLAATNPRVADPLRFGNIGNFYLAYHGLDDRALKTQLAQIWRDAVPELSFTAPHCRTWRGPDARIRIGFVSTLFKNQSVGRAISGLIVHLSRQRFEVHVFDFGSHDDDVAKQIQGAADRHISLPFDLKAAQQAIANARLDVLMFPDIGMEPMSYCLAFARLAPVQLVTWGHLSTTGLDTIDAYCSHADWEPADGQDYYTERLECVADCAIYPMFARPELPEPLRSRAAFGLDDHLHYYVCPQSPFKIHPDCDALFGEILRRDPAGRLLLFEHNHPSWQQQLRERLQRRAGIDPKQLVVLPAQPYLQFRNVLAVSDVVLDTLHVGGGITSMDAFATGTPIVTLPGASMRGRFTQACYLRMGINDGIVTTQEEYVERAVRFGTDSPYRDNIRSAILAANYRLYDDMSAVHAFEQLFERVVLSRIESA